MRYFVVNVNTSLGERMAMLIEGNNPVPSAVSYNGKDYKVILDSTGTTPDDIANVPEEVREQIEAFVERMYTVALGRPAEESGLEFWTNMLLTHKNDGAGLAQGFLLSPEFKNKNYSDEEYIKVLYKTFFNRDADTDPSGFTYWKGILSAGNTREYVLAGFVNSTEFDTLCKEYGITRGIMREDGTVINPGIWQFSERLYTKVLERSGEKDGIEYWTCAIADGVHTPEDAAKEFFWSPEYLNKQTSDEKYVETLYQTFFDREADADGLSYWLSMLDNGSDREFVLEGFAQSDEFKVIMARYGL